MPVSEKLKVVFVHIPKAGGSSFEAALPMPILFSTRTNGRILAQHGAFTPPQHANAATIRKQIGETKYKNFFKFSIVRNPWDRIVSEYSWRKGQWSEISSKIGLCLCRGDYNRWGRVSDYKYETFEDFVYLICERLKEEPKVRVEGWDSHLEPQVEFFDDEVDFIGKFEHMRACWRTVCRKLDIPCKTLRKTNASKHNHYTEYYTKTTANMIGELYREDVIRFKYKFGEEI